MNTLVSRVHQLARHLPRPVQFMEVCGTHTMTAFRSGLRDLLPGTVRLISGPGCPVCVTDTGYIDAAVALCRRATVTVASFGDLLRVPGSESSLEQERAAGADVRIVYSPTDALLLAQHRPEREVVFLGVGFETTVPAVAASISRAAEEGLDNFSVLCAHKTMPRAMEALVKDQTLHVDGFLCPGHVSVVTGAQIYEFLARDYRLPCVVSGFEPWDMLQSLTMLLQQVIDDRAAVEIQYSRSVTRQGNRAAQALIERVFAPRDAHWRGIGTIAGSGLAVRPAFAAQDAAAKFALTVAAGEVNPACRCGEVLRGVITPADCRLFGKACRPDHPFGPCMVSSEGTCAAWFKYERRAAA